MNLKSVFAAAVLACAAAAPALAEEQQFDAAAFRPALTRAEVIADLQVYRESGLAAIESQDNVDRSSAAYEAARARYAALRSSPAFAARVDDVARQRGERVAGVALASQIVARLA